MRAAGVEDGVKPGTTAAENAELREAKKRIRLLEQENEVRITLRRFWIDLDRSRLSGLVNGTDRVDLFRLVTRRSARSRVMCDFAWPLRPRYRALLAM